MQSISANLNIMIKAAEKASRALIRDFGEIAEGTFVSMDTSITKNITEPWGMYRGSPARRLKNVE